MMGSRNLFTNVKVIKNVGKSSCLIIVNELFHKCSKQSNEICKPFKLWYPKYDLKILYKFGLSWTLKAFNGLSISFPLCIHTRPKPTIFWIKNLTTWFFF
jgi:hypothetical protein